MKYKTLFRVLQKLVGLLVCSLGVVLLAAHILGISLDFFASTSTRPPIAWWRFIPIHGIVGVALGLYLFFGGKWIADLAIPGNRPYCDECGYDLTNATGDSCPE